MQDGLEKISKSFLEDVRGRIISRNYEDRLKFKTFHHDFISKSVTHSSGLAEDGLDSSSIVL